MMQSDRHSRGGRFCRELPPSGNDALCDARALPHVRRGHPPRPDRTPRLRGRRSQGGRRGIPLSNLRRSASESHGCRHGRDSSGGVLRNFEWIFSGKEANGDAVKEGPYPERYRSGRNGIDSKSIWGPKALTGVRIPLSPPDDSPRVSSAVQKPSRNGGFFVAVRPKGISYPAISIVLGGIKNRLCTIMREPPSVDKSYPSQRDEHQQGGQ